MVCRSCRFIENVGYSGGAVSAGSAGRPAAVGSVFTDCEFTANSAVHSAGAIGAPGDGLVMSGCVFRENTAPSGGAVGVGSYYAGAREATISHCVFEGNTATSAAGALGVHGPVTIEDCLFHGNSVSQPTYSDLGGGGALCATGTGAHIRGCTFSANWCAGDGGAVALGDTVADVSGCTFWGNRSDRYGSVLYVSKGVGSVAVSNTIIAFNQGGKIMGFGVDVAATAVIFTCSGIFGNVGGDWTGRLSVQREVRGNLWLDPLFCDPAGGDFGLRAGSPCGEGECGLIGAWPVGCGAVGDRDLLNASGRTGVR
jgi:hypothetical protein